MRIKGPDCPGEARIERTLDSERLARFADDLARLWPEEERGGPLGLAVSGGPDSLALLLLAEAAMPGQVMVASVDHGLREEAAGEVAMVEQLCRSRGIPFTPIEVSLAQGNLQARAREARYAALAQWASQCGLGAVASAHHADDQAETLLMRLVRGSGLAGLAGVRDASLVPGSDVPLLRPLLGWRKAELEDIVHAAGLQPARDPSNADLTFDRVRVRRHLAEHDWLDPEALATSAAHLADAWRAIEWFAEIDWEEMVVPHDGAGENRAGDGSESAMPGFTYYANVPRAIAIETMIRIIGELGGRVSRSEAARAWDRLWRGENASLGGVLVVPGIERLEKIGATVRAWRFTPEPPRRVH